MRQNSGSLRDPGFSFIQYGSKGGYLFHLSWFFALQAPTRCLWPIFVRLENFLNPAKHKEKYHSLCSIECQASFFYPAKPDRFQHLHANNKRIEKACFLHRIRIG